MIMNSSEILKHYVICALWSSTDYADDSGGEPLDANYSRDDISPNTLADMLADIEAFTQSARSLLEKSGICDSQIGHDFWLTRNGHGAGFWDRGLGEVGELLTAICKPFGSVDLYVGDDGQLYA
jgi:hypothetical protein